MSVQIEVSGQKLFGHHGVNEEERRNGQWFRVDVTVAVGMPARDSIGETVDYRQVAACVREVVEQQQFELLEMLGAAVADTLLARFPRATEASVSLGKPEVTLAAEGNPRVVVTRLR